MSVDDLLWLQTRYAYNCPSKYVFLSAHPNILHTDLARISNWSLLVEAAVGNKKSDPIHRDDRAGHHSSARKNQIPIWSVRAVYSCARYLSWNHHPSHQDFEFSFSTTHFRKHHVPVHTLSNQFFDRKSAAETECGGKEIFSCGRSSLMCTMFVYYVDVTTRPSVFSIALSSCKYRLFRRAQLPGCIEFRIGVRVVHASVCYNMFRSTCSVSSFSAASVLVLCCLGYIHHVTTTEWIPVGQFKCDNQTISRINHAYGSWTQRSRRFARIQEFTQL